MRTGVRPDSLNTMEKARKCYTNYYDADRAIDRINGKPNAEEKGNKNKNKQDKNNKKRQNELEDGELAENKPSAKKKPPPSTTNTDTRKACSHCGLKTHSSENCWSLESNAGKCLS